MKKLLFTLTILFYSCNIPEDFYTDIDNLEAENVQQNIKIDSLLTIIITQQEYIDSLHNAQKTTLESLIDSLISESSISDSLLQLYADSLNTVQNAYIDSLHNAQQITFQSLANGALSAGFVETEVYSGTPPMDIIGTLSLTDVIGTDTTLVLLKLDNTNENSNWLYAIANSISSDGGENLGNGANLGRVFYGYPTYALLLSYNGTLYWRAKSGGGNNWSSKISVVFYLKQ
tara:strand:+ start:169 stop:861 length:693 start_codon:yes stop_codon:yes gene_type:complete